MSQVVSLNIYIFFFNQAATTEIYTLSLHDALPISWRSRRAPSWLGRKSFRPAVPKAPGMPVARSEEHTSELQSRPHLVCRLLLEKKKKKKNKDKSNNIKDKLKHNTVSHRHNIRHLR